VLGSDSNSNIHSWREALISKIKVNWRSNLTGKTCIDSLRVDKQLFRSVKKICGQRYVLTLAIADNNGRIAVAADGVCQENSNSAIETGVSDSKGDVRIKVSIVDTVVSSRFSTILTGEEILKVLSYKNTWQKIIDSKVISESNMVKEDVKSMIQNAHSEWSADRNNIESTGNSDSAESSVEKPQEQVVRALLVRRNLNHISNQIQHLLQPINPAVVGEGIIYFHTSKSAILRMDGF